MGGVERCIRYMHVGCLGVTGDCFDYLPLFSQVFPRKLYYSNDFFKQG